MWLIVFRVYFCFKIAFIVNYFEIPSQSLIGVLQPLFLVTGLTLINVLNPVIFSLFEFYKFHL